MSRSKIEDGCTLLNTLVSETAAGSGLAAAAIKGQGILWLAGWSIMIGFPVGIFQIAKVGLHAVWTDLVDEWPIPRQQDHTALRVGPLFVELISPATPLLDRPTTGGDVVPGREIWEEIALQSRRSLRKSWPILGRPTDSSQLTVPVVRRQCGDGAPSSVDLQQSC
jgi:hypothetical protein